MQVNRNSLVQSSAFINVKEAHTIMFATKRSVFTFVVMIFISKNSNSK